MANNDKQIINLIRKQKIDIDGKLTELAKKIQQSQEGSVNSIKLNNGAAKTGAVTLTIKAEVDSSHCLTFIAQ